VNHVLEHRSRPEYVAFVGNETLVTRCIDGATYVWTLGAEKVNITTIPREPAANPLQITREDATLSAQGTRIFGTVHNREIDLQFPTAVGALALSPGGDAFAAGSKDALFEITQDRLYRLDALDKPFDLHHRDGINHVTFSHQGDKLVTCSEDFSAILWDAKTGVQIGKPMRHRWQVAWACFSSDDKWVATVGWDDACVVWDAATGEPLTIPVRINDALERVAFAPGNNSLLIHGRSNMFRLDLPIASLPLDGYKAPLPMTTLALDTR
jgi:WD40 repeat protein